MRMISLSWDNARELYAEDEFDDDRVAVYQPPPLNEVWLDETEHCEKKNGCDNSMMLRGI